MKGNTQVVLPYVAENFGALQDPAEKEIPRFTLRNLPYLIDLTVEYTLGRFRELFDEQPSDVVFFRRDPQDY
jgi:hypothetical protein